MNEGIKYLTGGNDKMNPRRIINPGGYKPSVASLWNVVSFFFFHKRSLLLLKYSHYFLKKPNKLASMFKSF